MSANHQTTSIAELTAILLVRLGFLWLLVFIALLLPSDDVAFYTFMGMAFIVTIPYSLWLRNRVRIAQFAPLQFLVDLILVTGLVYYTGGIQSDLTLLYPLVIISAGIVGSPKQAAEITILAVATYTLMVTLLNNHMIVEYLPAEASLSIQHPYKAVLLRSTMFALFGGAGIYVAKRCNFSNEQKKDLKKTTSTLLRNIPAPALLLDREGTILFANQPVELLLKTDEAELCGTLFAEWCLTGKAPIADKYGNTAYVACKKSDPVPVAFRSLDFQLQKTALFDVEGSTNEEIDVTLITLSDISKALEQDRQLHKVERITAATRIAGEMAHEIRTPLTAISASIQLLRNYEEKATSADWLPRSPRRVDRRELFDHIEDASQRMNDVVKNFVDFAEFSPADLLSIIKLDSPEENQGYIAQLNTLGRDTKNGQNTDSGRRPDNPEFIE